jgi:ATP-dependent Clp protease ATP-binding subunit ClpA
MFERFVNEARAVVAGAEPEARELGSRTIEAEHLLLALTTRAHTPVQGVLAEAGLDHEAVVAALDAEFEHSLLAVGVSASDFDFDVGRGRPVPGGRPRFATSSKLALERALRIAKAWYDRRIEPAHILLGILRAEAGTVPRALAAANVDRAELAAAATATIGPRR